VKCACDPPCVAHRRALARVCSETGVEHVLFDSFQEVRATTEELMDGWAVESSLKSSSTTVHTAGGGGGGGSEAKL
jgi:hypothetical protein